MEPDAERHPPTALYDASPITPSRRRRATRDEMEERAEFLIDYARRHGPVTVRGLYYQAEVHGIPGIEKTDAGYAKVQRQVLELRRQGRLPYYCIADLTRSMRKPYSNSSIEEALTDTARLYRKALWSDTNEYVEVWCEKDALAGAIYPVTSLYDVPLMVTRGFPSETFCFEAVAAREHDPRLYVVYYLGDFDRAGRDAASTLQCNLARFAIENGVRFAFCQIAVSLKQIQHMRLPTRVPKRNSPADRNWEYDFCCELDAIPPDEMRSLVKAAIDNHLPEHQFDILKAAEESERSIIYKLVASLIADDD